MSVEGQVLQNDSIHLNIRGVNVTRLWSNQPKELDEMLTWLPTIFYAAHRWGKGQKLTPCPFNAPLGTDDCVHMPIGI